MSRSELSSIKEMCSRFLRDTVPEYVSDAAKYILSDNGVQKINIQEGETWEVQGTIQGEGFQVYTPSLLFSLTGQAVTSRCNCEDSFSGICRHVAALTMHFMEDLRREQGGSEDAPPPAVDWKRSFRSFFSADVEPEPGRYYLIFR
ncbi:MAG: ATP-dependent helicase, partial [Desulfovibrio sp.]|nr:ATP-dependent helicase [Desulfovibrio sp.]